MARHRGFRIFAFSCLSMCAVGATASPEVHWVWHGERTEGSALDVGSSFVLERPVDRASLRVATDFCDAVVLLNGREVSRQSPYDSVLPLDVTRWVAPGSNVIRVVATATGGPSAIAAHLQVRHTKGTVTDVVSNEHWVSPRAGSASSFGRVDGEPWWQIRSTPSINAFDEYNQWTEVRDQDPDDVGHIQIPQGFEIDVIQHSDHGRSWISMSLDDHARLLLGREKDGIARLTIRTDQPNLLEEIDGSLQGVHGLLWTPDGLFASASDSQALFRLRDMNADGTYDDVRLLRTIPGGRGDHGRNDLTKGPDGWLYLICGDSVDPPDGFESRVPSTAEFGKERRPLGGHVVRTDADGSTWEIVASGLRNPYGIDFNRDGEMFTYDADSERHVGLPWYRPTRMNHIVFGADYGWRSRGRNPWPLYLPDFLPPNVLIGRGSPTSVKFTNSKSFPTRYRDAMFALEWAFGRVFVVHAVPRGASYSMHAETFMRGRPLNVVDVEFAADGAMYLLTGGRGTRSTVYRVRYVGRDDQASSHHSAQQRAREAYARRMRVIRQELEQLQLPNESAISISWPYLKHSDRWIRHAARIAIEHQPTSSWADRALGETDPDVSLRALLALTRCGDGLFAEQIWDRLRSLPLSDFTVEQQLIAVRIGALLSSSLPSPEVLALFNPLFPSGSRPVNRELCTLLATHGSTEVVAETLGVLAQNIDQIDALHYIMTLSTVGQGWDADRREAYFRLLRGARLFLGDEQLPRVLAQIETDALQNVPESERGRFRKLLKVDLENEPAIPTSSRSFVKKWRVNELMPLLGKAGHDPKRGQAVFREALCSRCHRLGKIGRAFGPDLTGVAARFTSREILDAILNPSKVVSSRFRNHTIATEDGQVITGQVVWDGFRKSVLRVATDPMRMDKVVELSKRQIVSHQPSSISPMPSGLLDVFDADDIGALMSFLQSPMQ